MKHECFSVLHPWAYELDLVDFKYVMNNDLKPQIMKYFKQNDLSIVFWFTFFKNQIGCGSDDFIEAVRQLCEMNKLQGYWDKEAESFKQLMIDSQFSISLEKDALQITEII